MQPPAASRLPPIGALIFDMDGTLVPSMAAHAQSWVVFAQRHGIALDLADWMPRSTGRNGLECMRALLGPDLPEAEGWRLIAEKEAIYRALYAPHFAPVDGLMTLLQWAADRSLPWGIGTAADQDNIQFVLQGLALTQAPQVVVGGDQGLPGKPEPAIFLAVAQALGVEPARCLVFEDAPLGLEAARRAGMRAIGICTSHAAAELQGPQVLGQFPDFSALMQSALMETLNDACA